MNIHGEYGPSLLPKLFLATGHLLAVILAAWLLFGGGLDTLSAWLGIELRAGNLLRKIVLMGASIIYYIRLCFTGYFLHRKMAWSEVVTVTVGLFVLHLSFAILGGSNETRMAFVGIAGCMLYLVGSYLNTISEYKRYRWKQKPENQGGLYTEGLFRYSMHINYFGDTVLFTGFALLTGSAWALFLPVVMAMSFIFLHIPTLDAYLSEKYGEAFDAYAGRTRKFVPGIY